MPLHKADAFFLKPSFTFLPCFLFFSLCFNKRSFYIQRCLIISPKRIVSKTIVLKPQKNNNIITLRTTHNCHITANTKSCKHATSLTLLYKVFLTHLYCIMNFCIICVLYFCLFLFYMVLQCGNKINSIQVVVSVYMPGVRNFASIFLLFSRGLSFLTPAEIHGLLYFLWGWTVFYERKGKSRSATETKCIFT